jgi:hypothetical protein
MKSIKANKYYKYIYNVYYDIKKVRLINVKQQRISQLADEFIVMESFFKNNREIHKRKNIFSYSVIIYMILKRNKIKGYDDILLPHHVTTLQTSITSNCI